MISTRKRSAAVTGTCREGGTDQKLGRNGQVFHPSPGKGNCSGPEIRSERSGLSTGKGKGLHGGKMRSRHLNALRQAHGELRPRPVWGESRVGQLSMPAEGNKEMPAGTSERGGGHAYLPPVQWRHRPPSKASSASSTKGGLFVHRPEYFPHTLHSQPCELPPPHSLHTCLFSYMRNTMCVR